MVFSLAGQRPFWHPSSVISRFKILV